MMTFDDFLEAKFSETKDVFYKSNKKITPDIIAEYNEIITHIKNHKSRLDNNPIRLIEWIRYNQSLKKWEQIYEGKLNSMDAQMMKPNKPNYFRANND